MQHHITSSVVSNVNMELVAEGTQPMSAELFYGTISLLCQIEDGIEMLMGPAGLEGNLTLAIVSKIMVILYKLSPKCPFVGDVVSVQCSRDGPLGSG